MHSGSERKKPRRVLVLTLTSGLLLALICVEAFIRERVNFSALGLVLVYIMLLQQHLRTVRHEVVAQTTLLALTFVYGALCALFWENFSGSISSAVLGLVTVQIATLAALYFRRSLRRAPAAALVGLAIVLSYVLAAVLAPILAPYGQSQIVGSEYEPWSATFPFGTDNLGRDMLTRLIYGARNTISIAVAATALGFVVGAAAGLFAATLGGWVDTLLGRVVDILMAIPQLIFALLILTIVGTSITSLVLVIALVDATRVFRLARAVSMNVLALDFVEAARLRGEGILWIMRKEVLPSVAAPLIVEFGSRFCLVFLFISSLSFLGLGIQPPTADWGSMVKENATLIAYGDITPLLPAAAIASLAIGVNLAVDWFLQKTSGRKQ
jgi:peptide/nickel transport system permease protein